ncbi:MAG: PilZ domain-containing protein [Nitrospirota bacterium]
MIVQYEDESQTNREHQRYPISATADIKIKDENNSSIDTLVANISKSGLGVYSYVSIPDGTPVSVDLSFIGIKGLEKDTIEGKIIHSSKLGSLYYVGVLFDEEINPAAQPLLYGHFWRIVELEKIIFFKRMPVD